MRISPPVSQGASTTSGASHPQITTILSSFSPRPFASNQQTAWSNSINTASVPSSLPSIQDIRTPSKVSIVLYGGAVSQSSWYEVLLLLKDGIAGGDPTVRSSIPAKEG